MGNFIDLAGQKFGRLTVIERRGRSQDGATLWFCQCSCGNLITTRYATLKKGTSKSCGCLARDISSKTNTKHGLSNTSEYVIWAGIKARCLNPKRREYPRYGGRGIAVCERWNDSFVNFYSDMGPRPTLNHSIERIDNDGPYSIDNCRWATRLEQANNTRSNCVVIYDQKEMTIMEMSRVTGISASVLYKKHERGERIP